MVLSKPLGIPAIIPENAGLRDAGLERPRQRGGADPMRKPDIVKANTSF